MLTRRSRTRHHAGAPATAPTPRWSARALPAVLLTAALTVGTGAAAATGSTGPAGPAAPAPAATATPGGPGATNGTSTSPSGVPSTASPTAPSTGASVPAAPGAPSTPAAAPVAPPAAPPVAVPPARRSAGTDLWGPPAAATSVVEELAAAYAPPYPSVPMLTPPDAASRYQGQVTCDPVEKPGAVAIRNLLRASYGKANSGGITRACSVGGDSQHKEGRAYDWALNAYDPADRAIADSFLAWLVGPDGAGAAAGNARRLGVQYVIWDRQIWQAWSGTWKPYNGASPHTDHIHISLSWDGAFKRTSFWTGYAVTQVDHGPCLVYAGVLVAPYSGPNYTRCPEPLPPPNNPTGWVEVARPDLRSVVLRGWAKDADTSAPLALHVYVDGGWGGAFTADVPRADLGGAHGFQLRLPVSPGPHTVCVYAINVGSGTTNPSMGCPVVGPLTGNPVGSFERVSVVPGGLQVQGWTVDPDTDAPVTTHAYVGGRWAGATTASFPRPDVAAAYPSTGAAHGISTVLSAPPGPQQVCLYPINLGPGTTNPLLGCSTVVSLGTDPTGNLEQVRAGSAGSVVVSGWTLDPDQSASIPVHVYVDGRWGTAVQASGSRPDVAAAYPGWSAARGFSATLKGLAPGRHEVCAYAINAGPGSTNPLLRCASVDV